MTGLGIEVASPVRETNTFRGLTGLPIDRIHHAGQSTSSIAEFRARDAFPSDSYTVEGVGAPSTLFSMAARPAGPVTVPTTQERPIP